MATPEPPDDAIGLAEEEHQDALLGLAYLAVNLHHTQRGGIRSAAPLQLARLDVQAAHVGLARIELDRLREQQRLNQLGVPR